MPNDQRPGNAFSATGQHGLLPREQSIRTMKRRTLAFVGGATLCAALFVFAFVAAPKSCQWGNAAYSKVGIGCLIALFTMPFALRAGRSVFGTMGFAVGFVAFGCGVWLAGLFAANFRIICALF